MHLKITFKFLKFELKTGRNFELNTHHFYIFSNHLQINKKHFLI